MLHVHLHTKNHRVVNKETKVAFTIFNPRVLLSFWQFCNIVYSSGLLIGQGKKWNFARFSVKNWWKTQPILQDFRGTFWGKLRCEIIGKNYQFCGNFLGKFCKKSIGSALIWPAVLTIFNGDNHLFFHCLRNEPKAKLLTTWLVPLSFFAT